ncbi:MAG: anti-sigma factor family protein [Nitrospirota bacterium]
MYDCSTIVKLMHPFLDGALDVKESVRVDTHLKGCEDCREAFLAEKAFLSLIHEAAEVKPAPTFTAACLRVALDREVRRDRGQREPFSLPWVAAITGFAVAVLALIVFGTFRHQVPDLVKLAVQQHQLSLREPDALDVVNADGKVVSAWLEQSLKFAVDIPHSSPTGFELVGGRVARTADTTAAYVAYRVGEDTVSLLMTPPQEIRLAGRDVISFRNILFHPEDVDGYHTLEWSDSRHTYVLVASSPRLASQSCLICHGSDRGREFISGFANGI